MNDEPQPKSYADRQADFAEGVRLLGGPRRAAELLDIAERTMFHLLSGKRQIHDGFMESITKLLQDHAAACRDLAKRTDPLFTANRVPLVPRGRPEKQEARADG